jgi:hypothetical protein
MAGLVEAAEPQFDAGEQVTWVQLTAEGREIAEARAGRAATRA